MSKYVRETAAGKSISAWVILKGARKVATVQAHFGNSRVLVNVWQEPEAYQACAKATDAPADGRTPGFELFHFQQSSASGYGYDKLTSALSGLMIDGHALSDHCARDGAPKPPKGNAGLFPRDYKAPAGYSLANWGVASKATGRVIHNYHWTDLAKAELFGDVNKGDLTNDQWEALDKRADEMKAEWESSDDYACGYSSCYRESGLKYLEARGYRVIQAI